MGVPAFFRWLSQRYSQIVSHCIEEKPKSIDENTTIPVDTSLPNPHEVEYDNLYLDMNGIIHPCTHPENKPAPKNEQEMFVEIFRYIDRIFSVVRPRKMIYMAVDGVAPRAKMNQQRSRRFRAGKETREKHLTIERIRSELLQKGAKLPGPKPASEHFDSNCITPGTPFMARLAIALQYYVYDKLNNDPGWKNIQVILSDASAPGEGEHKIMDYIRRQRGSSTHDPNTRHCLCGADADLIMLGLATHEPYFTIIREEFKPNQPRPCEVCGQMDHVMAECAGLPSAEFNTGSNNKGSETEFIFIHLNILREYLQQELVIPNLPFPYEFERVIDDWVFMCFFVGNDFLPHLPSLEIRENAIDKLIGIYKSSCLKTNGWLTDSGRVNISRVQLIMKDLALLEDDIFKKRRDGELNFRKRNKDNRNRVKRQKLNENTLFNTHTTEFIIPSSGEKLSRNSVREMAIAESKLYAEKNNEGTPTQTQGKRKFPEPEVDQEELRNQEVDKRDEVKLWEDGYRTRYYQSKFGVSVEENPEFCINVGHQYLRGLCWVLAYYYQGCVSWTWYYPYHYAPFAVDFVDLMDADITFEPDSKPFNPLEQLMGVFPADSKDHVPPAWQNLMTDADSPVIDLYPTDFKIDLNGKRYDWQGVALLPFVDEARLLPVLEDRQDLLTDEEKERNIIGPDRYFVRSDHPVAEVIKVIYELEDNGDSVINPKLTSGVTGCIWKDRKAYLPGSTVRSPFEGACADIPDVHVISCFYKDPQYARDFVFFARLLDTVTMPAVTIGPNAIKPDRRNFNTKPMERMMNHSLDKPSNDQKYAANKKFGDNSFKKSERFNNNQSHQQERGYHQQSFQGNNYSDAPYNSNRGYQASPNSQFASNPYYSGQNNNTNNNPYLNNQSNRGGYNSNQSNREGNNRTGCHNQQMNRENNHDQSNRGGNNHQSNRGGNNHQSNRGGNNHQSNRGSNNHQSNRGNNNQSSNYRGRYSHFE